MTEFHEYIGNIHIHSRYSDGTGSVAQIIRAGLRAGLDYLVITDHRTLAGYPHRGWRDGLLVMVGEELGHTAGHYLGLGIKQASPAIRPQEMIDDVSRQYGVGFIAHPDDVKYPWPDWGVAGFDGFSLWNFSSQWRGALRGLWWAVYPFMPARAVTAPPQATRARWDNLNRNRTGPPIPAIGGSDAHAFGFRPLGLPLVILPYRLLFRAINTHVLLERPLTGQIDDDERMILEALRQGSCFVANNLHGSGRGFRFWAEADRSHWGMGKRVPKPAGARLRVMLPEPGLIVLRRDGVEVRCEQGEALDLEGPSPGVYRVEVYRDRARKWGWIFSNPIIL